MPTGKVKFFNVDKGFGFIKPDQGGTDIFVHATALEKAGIRSLAENQAIAYDEEQDRKSGKARAVNLRDV
jgi:CspA family cold shock protein